MDEEKKEEENNAVHDKNIQPADIERTRGLYIRSIKHAISRH